MRKEEETNDGNDRSKEFCSSELVSYNDNVLNQNFKYSKPHVFLPGRKDENNLLLIVETDTRYSYNNTRGDPKIRKITPYYRIITSNLSIFICSCKKDSNGRLKIQLILQLGQLFQYYNFSIVQIQKLN